MVPLSKAPTMNCSTMKTPYVTLITAQKLHDQCEVEVRDSDSDTVSANSEDTVKKSKDNIYIGHRSLAPSLALPLARYFMISIYRYGHK